MRTLAVSLFQAQICIFCHDDLFSSKMVVCSIRNTNPSILRCCNTLGDAAHLLSLMAEASNPPYREFVDGRHGIFESASQSSRCTPRSFFHTSALQVDKLGPPNVWQGRTHYRIFRSPCRRSHAMSRPSGKPIGVTCHECLLHPRTCIFPRSPYLPFSDLTQYHSYAQGTKDPMNELHVAVLRGSTERTEAVLSRGMIGIDEGRSDGPHPLCGLLRGHSRVVRLQGPPEQGSQRGNGE